MSELGKLEKDLGVTIERKSDRVIPGSVDVGGQEVVYFSDDGGDAPRIQFQRLTRRINPPLLKAGGASELGCAIYLPDGLKFHAMSYHGDIDGWRKQISQGAQELGLLTASIKGNGIVISDGREFLLSDCRVEFY
ncbi:hypothetical protein [Frateuria defendens]|uniref:hypothetical protein n=1 Tax=Frateuria defendens TaxID=2219559 RepID=UPI001293C98A|nr:hypothetical protein [Frateuria defendens]